MPSIIDKAKEKLVKPSSPKRKDSPQEGSPDRSIPPEPVQTMPDGDFSQNDADPALQAHNLARANKSCNKLQWDPKLAKDAHEYSKELAEQKKMTHSGKDGQGENLYMSTGDAHLETAVQAWLGEEKKYNGEMIGEGNLADYGHFTQCLWYSTTHVGMGKAVDADGKTYVVARYSPPGNMSGEKPFQR